MGKISSFLKKVFLSDKFTLLIRLILVFTIIEWIIIKSPFNAFISLLALLLTFSDRYIEKLYDIKLPKGFQLLIILFVCFSLFFWEIYSFYYKFAWWDALLHWFSGLALWFVWFLIMYVFYKSGNFKGPLTIIVIFWFCFSLAFWALWEIFEYSVDEFLGMNMQKARDLQVVDWVFDTRLWVQDTMKDLIIDAVGALIASISWFLYLKDDWRTKWWFSALIKSFENENKSLFKRGRKKRKK